MKKFLLLLAGLGLLAAGSRAETITLEEGKSLHFNLPDTWASSAVSQSDASPEGKQLRYIPKSGSNDAVLITASLMPDNSLEDRENLRQLVEETTEQFLADSVEGKAFLKELRLTTTTGYSVTFTDAQLAGRLPVKDDYKTMTVCFIYLGDKVMVFATIFSDDPSGVAFAESLRLLKSITLSKT